MDFPTHEIHEIKCPTNKNDFTLFLHIMCVLYACLCKCYYYFFNCKIIWNFYTSGENVFIYKVLFVKIIFKYQ